MRKRLMGQDRLFVGSDKGRLHEAEIKAKATSESKAGHLSYLGIVILVPTYQKITTGNH